MSNIEWLTSPEAIRFIKDHLNDDVSKLLLSPPAAFKPHIHDLVDQILSRRKAKTKLLEWFANEQLIMPPPLSLEQCSSPATAQYKQQLLKGEQLVDLTGGMGIDTLALSENFSEATYVEQNEWLCDVFKHNSRVLNRSNIQAVHSSSEEVLSTFTGKAHFFIDPARRDEHQKKVFHFENCTPNVIELLPQFRAKAELLLIKAAPLIDLTLGISQLQHVREIHVVSVKNEVKEILFLVDFQHSNLPKIVCVNLESAHSPFEFTQEGEKSASSLFGLVGKYLYDPNSSILKAGAFKSVGQTFGIKKLAANTHLYTSDLPIEHFPGRVFEVLQADCSKKDIADLIPDGKVNVITKNYPLSPDELKKKYKLKDGGESYLLACRDLEGKPKMILGKLRTSS